MPSGLEPYPPFQTARGHTVPAGPRPCARSEDTLRQLADELGKDRCLIAPCDVTDFESCKRVVAEVTQSFGGLDAVFANAGTGGKPGGFAIAPVESWRTLVEVNILGLAYTLQASLPAIKKAKGHVVITGSIAGRRSLARWAAAVAWIASPRAAPEATHQTSYIESHGASQIHYSHVHGRHA